MPRGALTPNPRWRLVPRAAACLTVVVLVAACGKNRAAASSLHFRAGLNLLVVTGFDISDSPNYPPCSPIGVPPPGKTIETTVMLELDGSEWVGRSSASAGTLEIRLRSDGVGLLGPAVAGSIRGEARDVATGMTPPSDIRAVFSGNPPAVVEGSLDRNAPFATGRISGSVTFLNSVGDSGSCAAVEWVLQPFGGV